MRALIKNSKKIVLNQVDPSERALIDDFVRKSLKQATSIRSLYDIDNELDGISFELTGNKPGTITFRTPCIQVVAVNGNIKVDLRLDSETNIVVDSDENGDYLDVKLEGKIISITATYRPELMGTTGQYIVTAVLEKEGFDTAIVPINVSVLYFDGSDGTKNYEELRNLPKINGKVLFGDRTLAEFGIQEEMDAITNTDIDNILN